MKSFSFIILSTGEEVCGSGKFRLKHLEFAIVAIIAAKPLTVHIGTVLLSLICYSRMEYAFFLGSAE